MCELTNLLGELVLSYKTPNLLFLGSISLLLKKTVGDTFRMVTIRICELIGGLFSF